MMTSDSSPSPFTAAVPDAASAAPTMPPISAWLELEGSPRSQVTRFHAIAAKLSTADSATASRGLRARVAIEVAMAFAVS